MTTTLPPSKIWEGFMRRPCLYQNSHSENREEESLTCSDLASAKIDNENREEESHTMTLPFAKTHTMKIWKKTLHMVALPPHLLYIFEGNMRRWDMLIASLIASRIMFVEEKSYGKRDGMMKRRMKATNGCLPPSTWYFFSPLGGGPRINQNFGRLPCQLIWLHLQCLAKGWKK